MTSLSHIDGIVDAITERITTNKASLGDYEVIEERDESPVYMDLLPACYVIPIADGKDTITNVQGMSEASTHSFPVIIAAYYLNNDITTALRTTRGYAYTLVDLFRGDGISVENGWVKGFTVEVGYYEAVDDIIHTFVVRMEIESIDA